MLLAIAWSPSWPAHIQEPTQIHPFGAKDTAARKSQGIEELSIRNWGKGTNIRTKEAPSASRTLHLGNYKSFGSPVLGIRDRDKYKYFLLFHNIQMFPVLIYLLNSRPIFFFQLSFWFLHLDIRKIQNWHNQNETGQLSISVIKNKKNVFYSPSFLLFPTLFHNSVWYHSL